MNSQEILKVVNDNLEHLSSAPDAEIRIYINGRDAEFSITNIDNLHYDVIVTTSSQKHRASIHNLKDAMEFFATMLKNYVLSTGVVNYRICKVNTETIQHGGTSDV